MPPEASPSEGPAPESTVPDGPFPDTPVPTAPSRWRILLWWAVRLAVLAAVPWTLWMLVPDSVTVAVGTALSALSLALLGPHDLPWRPVRTPGLAVLMWDLVLMSLGTACALALARPPDWFPLLLTGGLLAAAVVRAPSWALVLDNPWHSQDRLLAVRGVAAGTAALLVAGLASPLFVSGPRDARVCARMVAVSGGDEHWSEARPATAADGTSDFVGAPLWSAERPEWLVGGHGETVTFAGLQGVAVRAAADGRVLWHADASAAPPAAFRGHAPSYSPLSVHQVGDTVLVGYRYQAADRDQHQESLLIAYDARTGRRTWCEPGISDVRTDPGEPDRFVARVGAERSAWGLFDSAGGSKALLPLKDGADSSAQALFADGRVTVWDHASFSSYDTGTGELLARVRSIPGSAEGRGVDAVAHVGDVTVVSFTSPPGVNVEHDEDRHEAFGLAAYGAGGEELWNSVGTGPLEVGEPVVGTGFGGCGDGNLNRGFDGRFLTSDHPSFPYRVVAVDASDGTVAWISPGEFRARDCLVSGTAVGERLLLPGGAVVGAEGYLGPVNTEDTNVFVTANGAVVVHRAGPRAVFHALP